MDTNNQDKIDRYLLGRMSENERKAFEKEQEADPVLKKDFLFTKVLKEELGERARMKEKMSRWEEELEQDSGNSATTKRRWLYAVTSIAAIAIFGFFIVFNNGSNPGDNDVVRGTATHFDDVESLLQEQQFEEALSVINDKEMENESLINYYSKLSPDSAMGNGMGETGLPAPSEETLSPEEAKEGLEEALEDRTELKWLKAKAYIGLKQNGKALSELEEVAKTTSPFSDDAKQLIKKLR